MLLSLALPTLLLMAAAVLVTRGFETLLPESIPGMAACAVLSAAALWMVSGAGFALLYLWQDAPLAGLLGDSRGIAHMATLGAKASLIWGPIVLLTVITAPQRWKTARW